MKFSEIIDHASELLQRKGRLMYRSLQREFALDDDALEDLKAEPLGVRETPLPASIYSGHTFIQSSAERQTYGAQASGYPER